MRIDAARIAGDELILKLADARDAGKICYKFQPGEYALVKEKKRRSLDANAYAWLLIGKISEKTLYTPNEVYRNALAEFGDVICERVSVKAIAADDLERAWMANHIGRRVEREEPEAGMVEMRLYYGSSDFNRQRMAVLIELLVQDCIALDIETRPAWEIKSLLEQWEQRSGS